ncbi:MAG: hypothetical protein GEV09_19400 [Pseudonocardiaceae bacterium]|nr:hypothetical protein [Pseudonocardiaceae bacterium]
MTAVLVANVRMLAVELIRDRAAWVVAVGFPTLFFVVALPDVTAGEDPASAVLGQLAALAVLLVAVLQLPARIAHERASTWERFLHVLPGSPAIRVGARAVVGAALIAAATVPLLVIALLATPISESATTWLLWSVALLAGSIPALLLGITLAYAVRPKAVSPVATLVFVPML